jgi:hypothetical protein
VSRAPHTFRQSGSERRGMTKAEAANYCGCESVSAFDDWIRRGIVPGPIPGTHRWDRKAIDASLDRASGLATTMTETDYGRWKKARALSA